MSTRPAVVPTHLSLSQHRLPGNKLTRGNVQTDMTTRPRPLLAAVTALALLAALALACTGDDQPPPTATSTVAPTEIATPPSKQPTAIPPTASPTALPALPAGGEVISAPRPFEGSPFGGADLIATLAEIGLEYGPEDHGVSCTGPGSVGNAYGGPSGPSFTLWVYPTPEALHNDWELPPKGPPVTKLDNCPLGSDFAYANENLLLVFDEPRIWEGHEPLRERITTAFLALSSSTAVDPRIVGPIVRTAPPPGTPLGETGLLRALAAADIHYAPDEFGFGCVGAASYGQPFSSPSGPSFTLWVYSSSEALRNEWELPDSGPPITKLDYCPLASGFTYWNENLLLTFDEPRTWEGHEPLRQRITATFLSLQRAAEAPPTTAGAPRWLDHPGLPVPLLFPILDPGTDEIWLTVDPDDGSTFADPALSSLVPLDLSTAPGSYWLLRTSDGPEGPGSGPPAAVLSPNGDVWNVGEAWAGAVSPDGSHVAVIPEVEGATLEVIARSDDIRHQLGEFGKPVSLAWSTDNVLAIARGGTVYLAQAPDWTPVAATAIEVDTSRVAWSPDGARLAFFEADGLYLVDAALTEKRQLVALEPWTAGSGRSPDTAPINQAARWSPDGTRIAYTTGSAIHIVNVATGVVTPATPEGTAGFFLTTFAWSPDGTRIAVASEHPDHRGVVIAYADGSGAYQLTRSVAFSVLGWSSSGIATYLCNCP